LSAEGGITGYISMASRQFQEIRKSNEGTRSGDDRLDMGHDPLSPYSNHDTRPLKFIIHSSGTCPNVKWVVASRNWPDIEEPLERATQQATLCLELNAAAISDAVGNYIDYKVKELSQLQNYDLKTRDTVHQHLSSKADDTFLWVALVC
jgi:hypothetical protein